MLKYEHTAIHLNDCARNVKQLIAGEIKMGPDELESVKKMILACSDMLGLLATAVAGPDRELQDRDCLDHEFIERALDQINRKLCVTAIIAD
jgi:hypothetical protein